LYKRIIADNIGIDCSWDEGQADATAFFNAVFVDGGSKREERLQSTLMDHAA